MVHHLTTAAWKGPVSN